ncbi:MAG: hypothetical protein NZ809_02570 [Thermodesulfovibrio sp.]|nr:hypothetical protein [Thermodesulfovibrio sp.]
MRLRNYTNAAQKIGGLFFMKDPRGEGHSYIKIKKDGEEIWADIDIDNWDKNYYYIYSRKSFNGTTNCSRC